MILVKKEIDHEDSITCIDFMDHEDLTNIKTFFVPQQTF